ncbi:MAG: thiamine pyrophosphate-binding protein [Chloroflexi bacterium]|nr:thiamine pyrophosphate-binding protein [Chloroflexota bacterium]
MLTHEFIARFLSAQGVRRAFGHPGSDTIDLIAAMGTAGIQFTLTHHENTAAYMAAANGSLTGVPGVVVVTKGPGVTNVASGITAAHLDRRPLIVFSAMVDPSKLANNPHQDIPLVRFCSPISKLSAEVNSGNAVELMPRAYQTAISQRPGSVFLPISPEQVSRPLAASEADAEAAIAARVRPTPLDLPDVSAAAELLSQAKRPIAVVGVGVCNADASADLVAMLEAVGVPACVTLQAVGQVPADHPLYIGMFGWHDAPITRMIEDADLIVTVGLDGWDIVHHFRAHVPIVSLDTTDANDRAFQPVTIGLEGDLRRMLRLLAELGGGAREWGVAEARTCYREVREHELGISGEHHDEAGIAPQQAMSILREVTPRHTIFTADAGAHKSMACQAWPSYSPNSFIVSNGLSPMGVALGAALGSKLACPDRPVVCMVGDGGFLMYAGELATWARLGLPMVQVVMVDNALSQIKNRQQARGYDTSPTTFQEIDYVGLARSFGIEAVRVDNPSDYRDAVVTGLAANKPYLIAACLDGAEYLRVPSAV